jgi:hypothetical protein
MVVSGIENCGSAAAIVEVVSSQITIDSVVEDEPTVWVVFKTVEGLPDEVARRQVELTGRGHPCPVDTVVSTVKVVTGEIDLRVWRVNS